MSQFGELSKSALQIWRAFEISSPNLESFQNQLTNLVTIKVSKEADSQQIPDFGSLTPDRHTCNQTPKQSLRNLLDDNTGLNLESCPDQLSKFG